MLPRVRPSGTSFSPVVPFTTHRLPPAKVSLLSGATMRQLRLPRASSRPLRFPSLAGPAAAPSSSLTAATGSGAAAPGRWSTGAVLFRFSFGRTRGLSQLPRIPRCASAPLSDPGPASTHMARAAPSPRLTACVTVPPPLTRTGRPGRSSDFRDSITRLWHSLHTLRAALAGALRNVRFRVAANLSRAGLVTRRVSMSCFTFVSSLVT